MLVLANPRTPNKLKAFFKRGGIVALDWPVKSPHLNPIDNLWELLKVWIKKNPKNLQELVVEAFAALCTEDYCKKLYDSLPRRLPMVINNRGFRTKK